MTTSAARRIVRREITNPAGQWPPEARPLIDFLDFAAGQVPKCAFFLRRGERVVDSERFLEALRRDVATGPAGPRADVALQDLAALKELFGSNAARARRTLFSEPARV